MKTLWCFYHLIVVRLPRGETWLQSLKDSSFVDDHDFDRTKLWFPGGFGDSTKRRGKKLVSDADTEHGQFDLSDQSGCVRQLTSQLVGRSYALRTPSHH